MSSLFRCLSSPSSSSDPTFDTMAIIVVHEASSPSGTLYLEKRLRHPCQQEDVKAPGCQATRRLIRHHRQPRGSLMESAKEMFCVHAIGILPSRMATTTLSDEPISRVGSLFRLLLDDLMAQCPNSQAGAHRSSLENQQSPPDFLPIAQFGRLFAPGHSWYSRRSLEGSQCHE